MAAPATIPRPIGLKDPNGQAPHERRPIVQLYRYLDRLSDQGFFGKVVVSFQNGQVHDVRIEQTMKLDEL